MKYLVLLLFLTQPVISFAEQGIYYKKGCNLMLHKPKTISSYVFRWGKEGLWQIPGKQISTIYENNDIIEVQVYEQLTVLFWEKTQIMSVEFPKTKENRDALNSFFECSDKFKPVHIKNN